MVAGDVGIIGAGLAGLCTAYGLQQRGIPFTIYEAGAEVGGNVRSLQKEGYLVEEGPATIALSEAGDAMALIRALQLEDALVAQQPEAKRRYLLSKGKLRAVSPPALLLGTGFLTFGQKLRLLLEPFISRGNPNEDESLADFIRRRMGKGLLPLADAFVGGIYAGKPEALSMQHAFPKVWQLEQQHGSLVRGLRRLPRRQPFSFAQGMQQLPRTLAKRLTERSGEQAIRHNIRITRLQPCPQGWELLNAEDRVIGTHWQVVVTSPLHTAPQLPDGHAWPPVEYAPVSLVALGFRREDVPHPLDGFGFLVPGREKRRLLGVQFISSVFANRAPAGHVLLNCFIGGSRQPQLCTEDADTLVHIAQEELHALMGIAAEPTLIHTRTYMQGIPQYNMGYGEHLAALNRLRESQPGLYCAGNYFHGVSVPDTISGALRLAEQLIPKK